jgi:hypothetical protein
MELTLAMSHSPPQWRGWVPSKGVGKTTLGCDFQAHDGTALLCQSIKCPYPRAGAGVLVRGPRARRRRTLERGGARSREAWTLE